MPYFCALLFDSNKTAKSCIEEELSVTFFFVIILLPFPVLKTIKCFSVIKKKKNLNNCL